MILPVCKGAWITDGRAWSRLKGEIWGQGGMGGSWAMTRKKDSEGTKERQSRKVWKIDPVKNALKERRGEKEE
jgi:hypothetical protein